MSGGTSNVDRSTEASLSSINTGSTTAKASISTSTIEAGGEILAQGTEGVGTITTASPAQTHHSKSTSEKSIEKSLSHSILTEKMEKDSYHSKSTKQTPIDQIEAEAVEAAASAMAAVAAAVNSNSKMSPSSAASLAKNTVQKEPLLSAHTSSDTNNNLSGVFSSQHSFKDKNRADIMFTAQEVTVESMKIDLGTMKSLLQHEIQKIDSLYPQTTSLSRSETSKNEVDHNNINEKAMNEDVNENESEIGSSDQDTISKNSIKDENKESPSINKPSNDVDVIKKQNDETNLPIVFGEDETEGPCAEINLDETPRENESADKSAFGDGSIKKKSLTKITSDYTLREAPTSKQGAASSLEHKAESLEISEDLKNLTQLMNSNEALLRLVVLLSSTSQIIPRDEEMQKQDGGEKSIANLVSRKSINNNERSNIASDNENMTSLMDGLKRRGSDTAIKSSNINVLQHTDLTSNMNQSDEPYYSKQIKIASKLALDFYSKAQSEYDALLSCLPTLNDIEADHIEGGDKIVLDLLPSCSPDKDATAAFFRACSPQSEPTETEIYQKTGEKKTNSEDIVEVNEEKVRVTSTDGGIEVSQNSSPTNQINLQATSSDTNGSSGTSFFKKDVVPSFTPQSQSKNSALSVVNAIAGAATGVVGGIMTGGNSRSNSPGSRRKLTIKKKSQQMEQNVKKQVKSDANNQDNERNSSYEEDGILSNSLTSEGRDYSVEISREMLGLTVENVLERTIVRTVLANGAAKKAGAKVGSLIVKVGSVETRNLTHFEIIDELRQSQRPLKLVLRRVSKAALQGAREEMGRLIKGAGFGSYVKENEGINEKLFQDKFKRELSRVWGKKRKDSHIFNNQQFTKQSNKKGNLAKLGERLVWILTLLIIGLERESFDSKLDSKTLDHSKHSRKESYVEAAKSVSKVLLDFITRQFLGDEDSNDAKFDFSQNRPQHQQHSYIQPKNQNKPIIKGKSKRQQIFAAAGRLATGGMNKKHQQRIKPGYPVLSTQENTTESPLSQIGDVLHRVQPFLADQFSPPAALLRGEVIAFICDVLDYDTEMELSESETLSSSTSSGGSESVGAVNELGSAGSLLKLIVRNCALMKSPTSDQSNRQNVGTDDTNEVERKYEGNKFLAVVHRLAASRSTSARVTACSLGPVLWGYLDFPHQLQLRGVITRALHDVEVIVRKSTAGVLHEIAELVFDPRAVPWLVLMCERAMTDPEPQLRAAAMTLTWHLAEHLPNAFLGDASKGSRSLSRLPARTDPTFAEVYLLQCKLLPVATRLAEDNSFSVRLAVAAQCDRLCSALGDHWSNVIIDILQALLDDKDERVRSEATLCLPRLVESVIIRSTPSSTSNGVLECLFPTALKLLKDPSTTVRVSLATSSGELLTLLVGLGSYEELSTFDKSEGSGFKQHKRHVDETLIPLVQRLLHDPDPEVTSAALRAVTNASRGNVKEISTRTQSNSSYNGEKSQMSENIISSEGKKEPVFIPVLSEEQVLRLLPTLSDLATSPQWRVRQSAVEIVPALLGCTQRLEMRSRIAQLCVQLMEDEVDAVRRTAAECLCLGGGSLGGYDGDRGEWVTAIVIPHIQACRENKSAKQRMLCLKMVEVMLKNGVCPNVNEKEENTPIRVVLEIAASLFNDKVVNVRLNVGRVFRDVAHVLDDRNLTFTIELLSKQIDIERKREKGGDRDVLFFAEKAILRCRHFLKNNKAALI